MEVDDEIRSRPRPSQPPRSRNRTGETGTGLLPGLRQEMIQTGRSREEAGINEDEGRVGDQVVLGVSFLAHTQVSFSRVIRS